MSKNSNPQLYKHDVSVKHASYETTAISIIYRKPNLEKASQEKDHIPNQQPLEPP